jgi:hypothetical protein
MATIVDKDTTDAAGAITDAAAIITVMRKRSPDSVALCRMLESNPGDVSLRLIHELKEEVVFTVHRALISLASPVLSGALASLQPGEELKVSLFI